MVKKISKKEISEKIKENDNITGICVIKNHLNEKEAVMWISDEVWTYGFQIDYNDDNLQIIKDNINKQTLLFVFTDKELQKAWIMSYINGGINSDRFDRRADFHVFNQPNELFCIDSMLLLDLTGRYNGVEMEHHIPKWKRHIVKWYKEKMIMEV